MDVITHVKIACDADSSWDPFVKTQGHLDLSDRLPMSHAPTASDGEAGPQRFHRAAGGGGRRRRLGIREETSSES